MRAVRYLVEQAHFEGVKYFFGMQGGGISALFNELYNYPYIKTILSRHEQGAIFEATGRDSPGCDQEIQERVRKTP
jgi:thiamine pyrophosphate-dependent acetolactate synthase large subunit-like protein